jgi:hypothetical protein
MLLFSPAFAVYGNGLNLDIPFIEMARQAHLPFMETVSGNF